MSLEPPSRSLIALRPQLIANKGDFSSSTLNPDAVVCVLFHPMAVPFRSTEMPARAVLLALR
jgi:hypothetical protein